MYTNESTPLLPLGALPWSPLPPHTFAELQLYAMTKGWVRTRWFAVFMCATTWWLFLILAITFAVVAPPCASIDSPSCTVILNQQGIRSKLSYLSTIGINTVWLSPIFQSPMKDFGYDISDFRAIDPLFGTMEDFRDLVKDMKKRDMHLILDFVPNHSSDEHDWFIKSVQREEPYTDYYVWAKPKNNIENSKNETPQPPNNWLSVFGGSAWQFHETRGEFYLHQFAKEQPDLNFRNPKVLEEMKDVLKFWLKEGVSGFRVDAVPHLLEDELLRDEPRSNNTDALPDEYAYLEHTQTYNMLGVLDIMKAFRDTLEEYADKEPKLLLAEVYDTVDNVMVHYGKPDQPIADFPFNFLLVSQLQKQPTAEHVHSLISKWMDKMPTDACANWVLGNHDQQRVATRVSPGLVDGLNMIALMLPGVAVTYYGEEIGMQNVNLTWDETVDPAGRNAGPERFHLQSRDPQRSPMQWNSDKNAGFSESNHTWLPVNENYTSGINVSAQLNNSRSHLNVYRALVKTRDHSTLQNGSLEMYTLADGSVFAFTRVFEKEGFLVAVNFGNTKVDVDFPKSFKYVPNRAELHISSISFQGEPGAHINTTHLTMESQDAVVIKFIKTVTKESRPN